MSALIRNVSMIRRHGKIFHYFEVKNHWNEGARRYEHHGWQGFAFAHGRRWRVLQAIDQGQFTTYECEPLRVTKDLNGYEWEVKE